MLNRVEVFESTNQLRYHILQCLSSFIQAGISKQMQNSNFRKMPKSGHFHRHISIFLEPTKLFCFQFTQHSSFILAASLLHTPLQIHTRKKSHRCGFGWFQCFFDFAGELSHQTRNHVETISIFFSIQKTTRTGCMEGNINPEWSTQVAENDWEVHFFLQHPWL